MDEKGAKFLIVACATETICLRTMPEIVAIHSTMLFVLRRTCLFVRNTAAIHLKYRSEGGVDFQKLTTFTQYNQQSRKVIENCEIQPSVKSQSSINVLLCYPLCLMEQYHHAVDIRELNHKNGSHLF